jgi:hypothetical protein
VSAEQKLIGLDKTKENIPRLVTAIVPTRNIHTEAGRKRIAEQVKTGKREPYEVKQSKFELEGVRGVIEKTEDALFYAASLARYKYSVNNAYISDIGAGLYSMVTTQGKGLYEWYELSSKSMKTGKISKTGARIICSLSTLRKAMFGPLVDRNGRAIAGTGDIVGDAWEKIVPILDGKVPMPRAYASINLPNDDTEIVIEGEPIHVYRKLSGARDAFIIDLDYLFFPALEGNRGVKVKTQYLHQVAGLTSFLQLGSKIHSNGKQSGIGVMTARKIILVAQAACELEYFAPGIVKETKAGRINISIRRKAIGDLYPSAVDNQGNPRFKVFSDAVALAGQYFIHAMDETGIMDDLIKGKVIIPATNRGAEFPKEYPQIVYIKADRAG